MFSIFSKKKKILDSNSRKESSGYKVHVSCLSHWNRLSSEDLPSPLDINILDFQVLYQNIAVTCSFLGWCWSIEEISSIKMPVQHHHFQTGLCGVAEIPHFVEVVWIIFSRQGVLLFSPGNKLLDTVKKRLNICEERFKDIAWMS